MAAVGARLLALPEPAHDRLQDGGKRRHSDSCCDQDGMLGTEHVACRSPEGTVNVDLKRINSTHPILNNWVNERPYSQGIAQVCLSVLDSFISATPPSQTPSLGISIVVLADDAMGPACKVQGWLNRLC